MTSKEISLNIITACKASTDLNDYITATYGKALTYARGLNLDIDYFSENEYEDVPIIIIDAEQNTIEEDGELTSSMVLHIKVVHVDEFKSGFTKVDNVITLDGIDEVEIISGYIITAIREKFAPLLDLQGIDAYLDALAHVSNFSEYNGHIVMTFTKESTIGGCNL